MKNLKQFYKIYTSIINNIYKNIQVLQSDNIYLIINESDIYLKNFNKLFKFLRSSDIDCYEHNVIVIYLSILQTKLCFYNKLLDSKKKKIKNNQILDMILFSQDKLNNQIEIIDYFIK